MRKLVQDLDLIFDRARNGPKDYSVEQRHRPTWPTLLQLDHERVQQRRECANVTEPAAIARIMIAWRNRWAAFAECNESDLRMVAARWNHAAVMADQRRPTENATATAAAQFGAPGSFSVTGFLARIGGRGGVVVLAADGTLRISPRSVVNETDRRDLRDHKAEIASALADAESF